MEWNVVASENFHELLDSGLAEFGGASERDSVLTVEHKRFSGSQTLPLP
jgi:hypothetical protein